VGKEKLLTWMRKFRHVLNYHDINDLEAWGLISRKKKAAQVKNKVDEAKTKAGTARASL
jgi:hypothetical protein